MLQAAWKDGHAGYPELWLQWSSRIPQPILLSSRKWRQSLNPQTPSSEHSFSQNPESEVAFTCSAFLWNKLPRCLSPHGNYHWTGKPSAFKASLILFTYKNLSCHFRQSSTSKTFCTIYTGLFALYLVSTFLCTIFSCSSLLLLIAFCLSSPCLLAGFAFEMRSKEVCRLVLWLAELESPWP